MIDEKDLFKCEQLCREFLSRAQEYHTAKKENTYEKNNRHYSAIAEHASLVRCSLDLWRALAYMRRRK